MKLEPRSRSCRSFRSLLGPALAFAFLPGLLAGQASAGCTNYEDYLHWISVLDVQSSPERIAVQGSYAYLTAGDAVNGQRLFVVDLTNESLPVVVGSVPLHSAGDIAVSGTTAAVANGVPGSDGLCLLDVSDPEAPEVIGSALPGLLARCVELVGSTAYVSCYSPSHSLEILDLSDPANPALLASVPLPYEHYQSLAVAGGYAYLDGARLMTVDVSPPEGAAVVDTDWPGENRLYCSLAVGDGYLYAVTRHSTQNSTFGVADLSNPANPVGINGFTTTFPGNSYPLVAYAAGVCYLGFSTHNVQMVDVSPPQQELGVTGTLSHWGQYLRSLQVYGPNLYTLRSLGPSYQTGTVRLLSVSSPSPLEPIGGADTPGDARSVAVSGDRDNLAYVADGPSGVQIVDITNPLSPAIIGSVDTPGFAADIVLAGSLAFVADGGSGLQVLDISNPTSPQIIGSVDTPGSAVDLAVVDTLVYIADTSGGLRIASVANPSAPVIVGFEEDELTSALGVDLAWGVAFIADGIHGLKAVDVSDPNNPWLIGGVKTRSLGNALKIDVAQDRAYVTDQDSGLVIVDVSDPEFLEILGGLGTQGAASDVNVFGIFAYVGSGAGVDLIDIRDPDSPAMVGNVAVPADAQGIFVDEFYAYVAAGAAGLQICPTQCGFDEMVIADFAADLPAGFYPHTIQFDNRSIGYGLSYDWDFGDGSPHGEQTDPTHTYAQPGDYTVTLTATNGVNTDIASGVVSALAEPATITGIADVPDDQGGFVYVHFFHSGYDDDELSRAELYTIQRLDGGQWVGITTVGAYGEHYYTALAYTQGDGEEWTTQFRVIAHMDEGNWASAPASGFSLDNIAPAIPAHLVWEGDGVLAWDAPAEEDFAYHTVYGSASAQFDEEATLIDYTIEPTLEVSGSPFPFYHVTTSDHAGNESEAAGIGSGPSSTPENATLPLRLALLPARPNPALGSATIVFDLPRGAHARLTLFDAAGRRVKGIADGIASPGRHRIVWPGLDDAGSRVPSGTYFVRLEAEGESFTRRLLLIR